MSDTDKKSQGKATAVKGGLARAPILGAIVLLLLIGGVIIWLAISATVAPPDDADATAEIQLSMPENGATVEIAAPAPEETPRPDEPQHAAEPTPAEDGHSPAEDRSEKAHADAPPPATPKPVESVDVEIDTTVPISPPATVQLAGLDPALIQPSSRGPLPVISPDGRAPWQFYARPVGDIGDKPMIAIVITGLGLSQLATEKAIALPGVVTLSFTPYGSRLDAEVLLARSQGHEVMLDLPMEPVSYPADDPGPHTLLTSLNPTDNIARLEWLLGRFAGYVGVMNHMGSKFTNSPDDLRPVLVSLKERGLMFLDSRASNKSVADALADQLEMPRARNDQFIDHQATRTAIDQAFAELENTARKRGVVVAVARPFPVTLERLAVWIPTLEQHGIAVVPVTAVANKQAVR